MTNQDNNLIICDICGDSNQLKSYIKLNELAKNDADDIVRKIEWITHFQNVPTHLNLRYICAICLQRINSLISSIKEMKKKYVITQMVLKTYYEESHTEDWMTFRKSQTAIDLEKNSAVSQLSDGYFTKPNAVQDEHKTEEFIDPILRKQIENSVEADGCTELEWLSDSDNYKDLIDITNENDDETYLINLQHTPTSRNVKRTKHNKKNSIDVRTNKRGFLYISTSQNHITRKPNGTFMCIMCKRSFKWRYEAEQHVRSQHTYEKPFNCHICKKGFTAAHYLNRHISCVHEIDKFVCQKCGRGFRRRYILNAHEKEHNGPPTLPCPDDNCTKMFYAEHILKAHVANTHGARKFICDQCGKSFRTTARLMNHRHRHDKKKIICPYCPKLFNVKNDLIIHLKYHKGTLPWRCGACDMYFKTTRGLQNHFALSHSHCSLKNEEL